MTRAMMAFVVLLGALAFVPAKANAGVYIRAPYVNLNINRPWGYRYYRPYRYYYGGGYNPWTVARYWTGLWGTLSGRVIPPALPPSGKTILERLSCDLVDDEDRRPEWLTTLADAPNAGPVRPEIERLIEATHELA